MRKIANCGWTAVGCLCFATGTLGICIPVLPTVPLYMATLFCFARGSKRLRSKFENSRLYEKHLRSFAATKSLDLKSKIAVMGVMTLVMGCGFAAMEELPIPRLILAGVWAFHLWYFTVRVKTAPARA